jgi:hypothetical protein
MMVALAVVFVVFWFSTISGFDSRKMSIQEDIQEW